MLLSQPLFILLIKATVVLLPLVPAFILFKYLPSSTAAVDGPLGGLGVKVGGAFGGYFILFLILWQGLDIDEPRYQTWTVTGRVAASRPGAEFHPTDIAWRVRPPDVTVNTDGTFKFQVAVPEKPNGDPMLPTVLVDLPGFVPQTLHLDDASAYGSAVALKRDYRREEREVRLIEPLMMQATEELPKFMPSGPPTAVPGDSTPPMSNSEVLP